MKTDMPLTFPEMMLRLRAAFPGFQKKYPIRQMGVFGSFSRGDQTPESDVDILIDFSGPIGWEIADIAEELEILLQRKVDLVPKKSVQDRYWPFIQKDLRYV